MLSYRSLRDLMLAPRSMFVVGCTLAAAMLAGPVPAFAATETLQNPILFVTQFPIPGGFRTISSVFANHEGDMMRVGRGGDLYIRYPDGQLRNLTEEAGYGSTGTNGFQDNNAIAVRDPAVYWDGTKAVFSMVIGAPRQYQWEDYYWQLYEVTGLGEGQTAVITKVPNQPRNYNNVEPSYASDGSIIFISDQPRNGPSARYLYPQMDEYESTPTPTGVWRLDRNSGRVTLLQDSPSGSSHPFVDSYGRIMFTRWDHLQRDQQCDTQDGKQTHGCFNYASEDPGAARNTNYVDIFPEPRVYPPGAQPDVNSLQINHFFPWSLNQDGTGEETLNHIGRHELFGYFERSFLYDPALVDFFQTAERTNQNSIANWLQITEDPSVPGRYIGIDAPEFYTDAAGQIIAIIAPPGVPANTLQVQYVTDRSGSRAWDPPDVPPPSFSGRYRNPQVLADGTMIASYTPDADGDENLGSTAHPDPAYDFRIYQLTTGSDGMFHATTALTPGITKTISFFNPDVLVSYSGPLWEFSPVEVRARPVPPTTQASMQSPEQQAFAQAGVDPDEFEAFMRGHGLGVFVSRNVTTRDGADEQQPYNLAVPGGVSTVAPGTLGPTYDISFVQFLQGDRIRGEGGTADPLPGRRVQPVPLHDDGVMTFMPPPAPGTPTGGVPIASDGSIAVIVPAQRAMVWQSTTADGTPVTRERYWISTAPGEVRACDGCHGVNQLNQAGQPPAQNVPQALIALLSYWRDHHDAIFDGAFD